MPQEKTYERYYSSSDAQIIITDIESQELLTLDLAISVGFDERAPLQPIYGLNNTVPSFFVRNNSIVSGFIGLAYKHEAYLKKAIMYVNGIKDGINNHKLAPEITTFESLKSAIQARDSMNLKDTSSSLASLKYPFNLQLVLSTDSVDGNFEMVVLQECYITGRSVNISSPGEGYVTEGYSFICSNLK